MFRRHRRVRLRRASRNRVRSRKRLRRASSTISTFDGDLGAVPGPLNHLGEKRRVHPGRVVLDVGRLGGGIHVDAQDAVRGGQLALDRGRPGAAAAEAADGDPDLVPASRA